MRALHVFQNFPLFHLQCWTTIITKHKHPIVEFLSKAESSTVNMLQLTDESQGCDARLLFPRGDDLVK